MSATDQHFTLTVEKYLREDDRQTVFYPLSGDGAFIVQTIDVLLADPFLVGFSLRRDARPPKKPEAQVSNNGGVW